MDDKNNHISYDDFLILLDLKEDKNNYIIIYNKENPVDNAYKFDRRFVKYQLTNNHHTQNQISFMKIDDKQYILVGIYKVDNVDNNEVKVIKNLLIENGNFLNDCIVVNTTPPANYSRELTNLEKDISNQSTQITKVKIDENLQNTIEKCVDLEDIRKIKSINININTNKEVNNMDNTDTNDSKTSDLQTPLNQIFYGPAGTGKTYRTVEEAVKICYNCDSDFYKKFGKEEDCKNEKEQKERRDKIKKEYKKLKEQEDRIQFITFHQSYSYEDFVEGIKPIVNEDNDSNSNIKYEIQDGIFKKLCLEAGKRSNFEEIWNLFLKDNFEENTENKIKVEKDSNEIRIIKDDFSDNNSSNIVDFILEINGNDNFNISFGKDFKWHNSITKKEVEKYLLDENYSNWNHLQTYHKTVAKYLKQNYGDTIKINVNDNTNKNYVLIIDEINRGNISKIFGELITLIEEDKRQGNKEESSCTLPYSQESFSVPKNLYIIGTMNTSDRSIASLDIALRRRFTFIEIAPKPTILENKNIDGVNLQELLEEINRKITILLDRDHCIGHSYFMNIENNIEKLKQVWFNKIIPLLNEYFYGDFTRLKVILKGFICEKNIDDEELKDLCNEDKYYEFKTIEDYSNNNDFINDLKDIYDNHKKGKNKENKSDNTNENINNNDSNEQEE